MAKQKCGTCRFFQEAGLAGSGWCHHPQRKMASDVLIMVRRNELACRDEWSRSLWAPKQGSTGDEPTFRRPPGLGPAHPANADDLRAAFSVSPTIQGSASDSNGEDVLLSEGRIVSERHEPPAPREPERSFPAGGFDPRTAVMRAREAYRERARARETAARHLAGAEAIVASSEASGEGAGPGELTHDVEPPELTPATRPILPLRPRVRREEYAPTVGADEPAMSEHADQIAEPDEGLWAADAFAISEVHDESWPIGLISGIDEEPSAASNDEPAFSEPELALDQLDSIDVQRLPAWFRSDLPRMCRSCRDYRPSAEGERGWCANAWAFTHRRLVHENDNAPCDSAIGDWWAPVDDVWQVAADVSSHGRATPLMDRMTARASEQRRRS